MVIFDTRYCVQTQEEIDAILEDVADTFVYYYMKEQREKLKKEKAE